MTGVSSALVARGLALAGRLGPTDLDLAPGSLTALVGPNGAGKTSLLHALAGVGRPAGEVRVNGTRLDAVAAGARASTLGYVPASRELAWPLSVRAFVTLTAPRATEAAVDAILGELDLVELAGRAVDSLSTGERTRVLLARALLPRPSVLLLDEPFANLDPLWQIRLAARLGAAAAGGMTILFSAHDLDLAGRLTDRVLIVDRARVVGDGMLADHAGRIAEVFGVQRGRDGSWYAVRPA